MRNKANYFAGSFLWGVIAKLLDAGIKFLTIPLLLSYFGKQNYGLLTLAISTNAYMQLLDMGMNTGGVKFFAQWIATGKYNLIDRVARTNISFYLIIGLLNSLILIILAADGSRLFKVSPEEFITFKSLLYILSAFCIVNWLIFVFNQLLIADEKIIFTQQMLVIKSIWGLLVIWMTIYFEWSIKQYFSYYLLSNLIIIFPYFFYCQKRKLVSSIVPALYWKDFSIVFKYGLGILAMSLFQFTATQSRPLILGMFVKEGVGILTEYRIIEVFPIFIISLGSMLISIFLPKTSKAIQNNDRLSIEKLAYEGTRYSSILIALLCFPIIINAKELLTLYVGTAYSELAIWLMLWVFTLTLFLHNSPISSLVLSSGKTKMLVYSSAIACVISVLINVILANKLGVGSAVIGYLIYVIIQMSFYYFYFNNRILHLNSWRVFKSFIVPTFIGIVVSGVIMIIKIHTAILLLEIFVKTILWVAGFVCSLFITKSLKISEVKTILFK